jgi:hypothetical protein
MPAFLSMVNRPEATSRTFTAVRVGGKRLSGSITLVWGVGTVPGPSDARLVNMYIRHFEDDLF